MPPQSVFDLFFGHFAVAGDEVERGLHAVAEADERDVCGLAKRQAVGRHGIGVLQHDGARAGQLLHIAGDIDQQRDGAQAAEDAAGTERIADALIDAVFERNAVVLLKGVDAADLHHDDDKIGVADGLAAVERGPGAGAESVVGDHTAGERFHAAQLGFAAAHQGELARGELRRGQNVAEQGLTEDNAARTDQRNLVAHGAHLRLDFTSAAG